MGGKKKSNSMSISLVLLFFFVTVHVNCSTTKYFIDLPSSFVETLQKNDNAKVELWHPNLSIRKVVKPLSETMASHPILENKFSSFLQVGAKESNAPDMTFLSSTGNVVSPEVDGYKMACNCRFVKDASSPSFIQTSQQVVSEGKKSNYENYDDSMNSKNSQMMRNKVEFEETGPILASVPSISNDGVNRNSQYVDNSYESRVQQKGLSNDQGSYKNYDSMPMSNNRQAGNQALVDKMSDDAEIDEFFKKFKDYKASERLENRVGGNNNGMLFAQTNSRTAKMDYPSYNYNANSGYGNNNNLRSANGYSDQVLVNDNSGYGIRSQNQMGDDRTYGDGNVNMIDQRRPMANQQYDNSYRNGDRGFLAEPNYVPVSQQRNRNF